MTLSVYLAVSLSRPYHSCANVALSGGSRFLGEVEKDRDTKGWTGLLKVLKGSEGPGALELDLKGVARASAGCLGLGRASCLRPIPPGTPVCPRELAIGLLPAGSRLSHRPPAESLHQNRGLVPSAQDMSQSPTASLGLPRP